MTPKDAAPVTLIGAGKMGAALARGWHDAGLPGKGLTLVDPAPSAEIKTFASETGATLLGETPRSPVRVLVIAVKPQLTGEVLPKARGAVGSQTLVISIAAGITIAAISSGLATEKIVRVMPNTPALIGKGMSGAYAAPGVSDDDRALADALMRAVGEIVWVGSEADIDIVTAVSGSGPAYFFHLVEALAAAGEAEGLDARTAMVLARQTAIGAAGLLESEAPTSAGTLRENVTSKGGTTAAALEVLMGASGLGPLMRKAVEAARKRARELGQ